MDRNISLITFLGTVIILLLLGAWFIFTMKKPDTTLPVIAEDKMYISEKFGFSFSYPKKYFLEEKEISSTDTEVGHFAIILTLDTEENRLVREGKSPAREGPTAITFNIYEDEDGQIDLPEWLLSTNSSNYNLAKSPYATTTIANIPAFEYEWSGLYEGETKAFIFKNSIIVASVTFIFPDELIRTDFEDILETFKSE